MLFENEKVLKKVLTSIEPKRVPKVSLFRLTKN